MYELESLSGNIVDMYAYPTVKKHDLGKTDNAM